MKMHRLTTSSALPAARSSACSSAAVIDPISTSCYLTFTYIIGIADIEPIPTTNAAEVCLIV